VKRELKVMQCLSMDIFQSEKPFTIFINEVPLKPDIAIGKIILNPKTDLLEVRFTKTSLSKMTSFVGEAPSKVMA
jgi:hypothetical protein